MFCEKLSPLIKSGYADEDPPEFEFENPRDDKLQEFLNKGTLDQVTINKIVKEAARIHFTAELRRKKQIDRHRKGKTKRGGRGEGGGG